MVCRLSAEDLRASGRVSALIMFSRILGLLREVVFASLFGAGAVADAFQVAFRIPNFFRDLLAEGALSSAFVPTFTASLKQEGEASAYHLGNLVLSGILVLTAGLSLLGVVFAEQIVVVMADGFGGNAEKVALAARLTRLMMPLLCFVSLGAVWMGMLNAQRRFTPPALAPALFNLVSLAAGGVVWALGADIDSSVAVWAAGSLAAGAVQAGIQVVALWRVGYRPRLPFAGFFRHPGVRKIATLMAPAVIGVAAVQINVLFNTRFAGDLGDGAVAQLTYAFRLFFLPLGMFGVALAIVTTTSVSEAAAEGDHTKLAQRTQDSVSAGWMLTAASAVGLGILAQPVVRLIFEHGPTSPQDSLAIARCLQAYVLGLVPYSLVKILAPAYYSVGKPSVPLVASVAGVAVNVGFNALLYRELGAPGLAAGTALGALVNVSILRGGFSGRVAAMPTVGRGSRFASLALALVVLGAISYGGGVALEALAPRGGSLLATKALLAVGLTATVVFAAGVYALVLRALGYPGAAMLLAVPGRVASRFKR